MEHSPEAQRKRRFARTEVEIISGISVLHSSPPVSGDGSFLVLGGGGALVQTETPYPVGCMLLFRFRLPGESEEIRCEGVVCDEVEELGVGVEFLGVTSADRDRIVRFVVRHQTTSPPQQR